MSSCVSITDEIVLRGILRGDAAGGLRELTRAAVENPPTLLENRYRRQASKEADAFGLRGQAREDFVARRIVELRTRPWSTLLPGMSHSSTLLPAVARTATPAPRVVLDRLARPRVAVTLTAGARTAIEQEIWAWAPFKVECGGLLFAHDPPDRGSVLVCHASPPATNSTHASHSVGIGSIARIEAELPDFLQRQNMIVVGDFHTHPSGSGEPSKGDRRNWAGLLTRRSPSWVGLIATRDPNGHGWSFPQLRAWHAYRADDTRVVVEPAVIYEP